MLCKFYFFFFTFQPQLQFQPTKNTDVRWFISVYFTPSVVNCKVLLFFEWRHKKLYRIFSHHHTHSHISSRHLSRLLIIIYTYFSSAQQKKLTCENLGIVINFWFIYHHMLGNIQWKHFASDCLSGCRKGRRHST